MSNEMDSLLDAFLYETNGLLDNLERILMQDEALADLSADDINEIFRIMHTTKSSSAMMGYNSISVAAHRIEDLFSYIREKNDGLDFLAADVKMELFNLLFTAMDYLRAQMIHIQEGSPLDEDNGQLLGAIDTMLHQITGAAPQEAAPTKSAPEESDAPDLPEDPTAQIFIHVSLQKGIMMENLRAFMIVTSLKDTGISYRYYPADMDSNNDTCQEIIDHGFFIALDSMEDAETAAGHLAQQNYIENMAFLEAPKSTEPVEEILFPEEPVEEVIPEQTPEQTPEPAPQVTTTANANNGPVKQNLISVNLNKLDQLNNLVGELVITESMVTGSPVLKQLPQEEMDEFLKSAYQLRKLTNELQDIAMSLRMVSIRGVFQKMTRVVRDMKQKLGKPVHLTLLGEDTEVDKSIIDAINDPILHLVRNCMDHGIESSVEERIEADKPEEGEILLSATNTTSEIVITVSDDGYGMDADKILDKAERKGLLVKPKEDYSRREALNLILLPGFSTNHEVTEFSGRGVGMDVVKRNVESIGGSLEIDSESGRGTTFTFHIPLTLAILDGMKVMVGDSIFTISIANIRQSFKANCEDIIIDENGDAMVCRHGNFYPIVRLDEAFRLQGRAQEYTEGILLWVEAYGKEFCLFADELIGQQQVVVKPLPQYLINYNLKNHGISGCTILGDGTISIILDVPSLYNSAFQKASKGETI